MSLYLLASASKEASPPCSHLSANGGYGPVLLVATDLLVDRARHSPVRRLETTENQRGQDGPAHRGHRAGGERGARNPKRAGFQAGSGLANRGLVEVNALSLSVRVAVMDPLANLNGTILPLAEARVPVLDRGFLFGDAVYEVLRVYRGKPWLMDDHFARLGRSLEAI